MFKFYPAKAEQGLNDNNRQKRTPPGPGPAATSMQTYDKERLETMVDRWMEMTGGRSDP
jgi:hypothetical protein